MKIGQPQTAARQGIQGRSLDLLIAVYSQIAVTLIVGNDEQYIGTGGMGRRTKAEKTQAK